MVKFSSLFVYLFIILFSVSLEGQSPADPKDSPASVGHSGRDRQGTEDPDFIKNEPKIKGTSFFDFGWLFGRDSRPESRSKRPDNREPYDPPEIRSKRPDRFNGRRTIDHSSNADFVRNVPSESITKSHAEEQLATAAWDLGILLGTSHSITDMQANKNLGFVDFVDYQTSNFNFGFGAFVRHQPNSWFAINGGMNYAKLKGSNTSLEGLTDNFQYEGFSFENDIYEFFVKTEFHVPFLIYNPSNAYIFTGISVFFTELDMMDPDGRLYTSDYDFEQVQPAIPIGLGYYYTFRNGFSLGYEFGWRYTLFPYLDGIKIDKRNYDSYFINSLTFSYSVN